MNIILLTIIQFLDVVNLNARDFTGNRVLLRLPHDADKLENIFQYNILLIVIE